MRTLTFIIISILTFYATSAIGAQFCVINHARSDYCPKFFIDHVPVPIDCTSTFTCVPINATNTENPTFELTTIGFNMHYKDNIFRISDKLCGKKDPCIVHTKYNSDVLDILYVSVYLQHGRITSTLQAVYRGDMETQ